MSGHGLMQHLWLAHRWQEAGEDVACLLILGGGLLELEHVRLLERGRNVHNGWEVRRLILLNVDGDFFNGGLTVRGGDADRRRGEAVRVCG